MHEPRPGRSTVFVFCSQVSRHFIGKIRQAPFGITGSMYTGWQTQFFAPQKCKDLNGNKNIESQKGKRVHVPIWDLLHWTCHKDDCILLPLDPRLLRCAVLILLSFFLSRPATTLDRLKDWRVAFSKISRYFPLFVDDF